MRTFLEYKKILKNKGFRYSLNEVWRKLQRLHWISNERILKYQYEDKVYHYLKRKYRHFIRETIGSNEVVTLQNEHPDKIWVCWLQGYENAPPLVQRCIESIKENANGREVILLTIENISSYVTIPDYIQKKYNIGRLAAAHYTDVLRVLLLAKYGGIWADATVLMTAPLPNYILDAQLFCYKSPLFRPENIKASNWFIAAKPNNRIIVAMSKVLCEYWRKENFLRHYFLFHFLFAIVIEIDDENKNIWKEVPYFNNVNPHVLAEELFNQYSAVRYEQICNATTIHKLTYKFSNKKLIDAKGTFYEKIVNAKL